MPRRAAILGRKYFLFEYFGNEIFDGGAQVRRQVEDFVQKLHLNPILEHGDELILLQDSQPSLTMILDWLDWRSLQFRRHHD